LVVLCVALAACSGDDTSTPSSDAASAASTEPTSQGETEQTDAPSEPTPTTSAPEVTSMTAAPTTTTTTAPEPVLGDPDGTDPLPTLSADVTLPIVFVHGFAGSAQQYESQAIRFAANGYPAELISAYEHDGAGLDFTAYTAGLTTFVDAVLAEHGVDQVYLVGHSRGTRVSSDYLSDAARAATVAKVVLIDGMPCDPALTVPCLAPNQGTILGQGHVEVATSKESFAAQYEFLVGEPPAVVDIVAQREPVVLSGRALDFPSNVGRAGVQLDVWALDPATGLRSADEPYASFELGPAGEFGPLEVATGAPYEWVLTGADSDVAHHLYLQPSLRSSHLVRLLSSTRDGATRANTNAGPGHAALVITRMREWYSVDDTDLDGDQTDVLQVAVDGGEPVDLLPEFVGNGVIGIHVHDDLATPGASTRDPLPYFSAQPFQSGVDVFLPADPGTTLTVTNVPRGDAAATQVMRVPAWPSEGHAISVVFADWAAS
jgi:pimeloyl-ACP methyl ester carboxylesterase